MNSKWQLVLGRVLLSVIFILSGLGKLPHFQGVAGMMAAKGIPLASVALVMLETEKVDLVFSDVVMAGGMVGFDLAERVGGQWPAVRFLMTSGFMPGPRRVRPDGRPPLPRRARARPGLHDAPAARLGALPHADRGPLSLRIGDAPGRRGHGRAGRERRAGNPEGQKEKRPNRSLPCAPAFRSRR